MTDEKRTDNEQGRNVSDPVVVPMKRKEQRFYDRLRQQLHEKMDAYREKLGERAFEYLMLLPDLFVLFIRLARDKRVTNEAKVVAGIALAYMMSPIDLIPDLVALLGYMDDVVLAVYALKRILLDVDQAVVLEHWTGDRQLLKKLQAVLQEADKLVGSRVARAIRRRIFKR